METPYNAGENKSKQIVEIFDSVGGVLQHDLGMPRPELDIDKEIVEFFDSVGGVLQHDLEMPRPELNLDFKPAYCDMAWGCQGPS
jgi:hypothetical protein